jgi:hypothetical protein
MAKDPRLLRAARRQQICREETAAFLRRGGKVARINQKPAAPATAALIPALMLEKKGAVRLVKSGCQGPDSGLENTKSGTAE